MPLFRCSKCDVVENTGLSGYWRQELSAHKNNTEFKPLCTQCDPEIGEWHGEFPREAVGPGWYQNRSGHLWRESELDKAQHMGPFEPVTAV